MTPRTSIYIAASLDGFIARADHGLDWLQRVERPGEDYGFADFLSSVDTFVAGRGTYDVVIDGDWWPYTAQRCVIVTNRPAVSKHGEEFFAGDLTQLFERLHGEGARHIYVDGGNVIGQALAADLVDTITVSIIPVILGNGISLVSSIGRDVGLQLQSHRAFDSGLVQLTYAIERGETQQLT